MSYAALADAAMAAHLGLFASVVLRVEILRAQKRLPADAEAVFAPVRRGMDTWGRIWGNDRRKRIGRALRLVFRGAHKTVDDPWTTRLVYACRGMLGASLILLVASGLMGRG